MPSEYLSTRNAFYSRITRLSAIGKTEADRNSMDHEQSHLVFLALALPRYAQPRGLEIHPSIYLYTHPEARSKCLHSMIVAASQVFKSGTSGPWRATMIIWPAIGVVDPLPVRSSATHSFLTTSPVLCSTLDVGEAVDRSLKSFLWYLQWSRRTRFVDFLLDDMHCCIFDPVSPDQRRRWPKCKFKSLVMSPLHSPV